jgi:hypothetical protein
VESPHLSAPKFTISLKCFRNWCCIRDRPYLNKKRRSPATLMIPKSNRIWSYLWFQFVLIPCLPRLQVAIFCEIRLVIPAFQLPTSNARVMYTNNKAVMWLLHIQHADTVGSHIGQAVGKFKVQCWGQKKLAKYLIKWIIRL